MKLNSLYAMTAATLGVVGIAALRLATPTTTTDSHALLPARALRLAESPVAGYKRWVRVNLKPHEVSSNLALLCRSPTPEELAAEAANPHIDTSDHPTLLRVKFVTVYVNEIGKRAMLHQKKPGFPPGSMIVKERLAEPGSRTPELLTVMHKREQGYDPAGGDWEFMVLDGVGKQVEAQGRLQFCQSCHAQWKATDYVSRAYLTADAMHNLR